MAPWTSDEIDKIGAAEELRLASVKRDGTRRNPVTNVGRPSRDDLYVRSVNGRGSSWFRSAEVRHEARIQADGIEKGVQLVETNDLNDEIDGEYRAKCKLYAASIIDHITSPEARAAMLRLVPR